MLRLKFVILITTIILVGFILERATATSIDSTWVGQPVGIWEDSNNWDSPDYPNNSGSDTYNVFIDDGGSQVSLTFDVTVDNLTIDSGNMLQNSGSFSNLNIITNYGDIDNYDTIDNFGDIDNYGGIDNYDSINNTGSIDNSGSILNNDGIYNSGGIINSGSIVNDGGIENTGGINNSGGIDNSNSIVNEGDIVNSDRISNSGEIVNEGDIVNYDRINNFGFGNIVNEGDIVNYDRIDNTGNINNEGDITNDGEIDNSGNIDNEGEIINNGNIINEGYIFNEGEVSNTNTVIAGASGGIYVDGNYTQTAGSTHLTDTTSMLQANIFDLQGGILSGFGTVAADVKNAGAIHPGTAPGSISVIPGSMSIEGAYTQLVDGILNIEIASLSSFDRFLIANVATLHGTLNVSLLDGFLPSVGDSFKIMKFDFHNGEFDIMNGLVLGGGLFFDPRFSGTDLTLVTQQSEPVPEPTTICLMGFGILGLLGIGIRQHRKNKAAR